MQTNARETKRIASAADGRLRSPLIIGLGALLAVQLVVALVLSTGGSDLSPATSEGPLLAFEPDQVTRLRIASSEEELVVERAEAGWRLPSLGGFPVSEIKISDLLSRLAGIQRRIPVATTEAAIARFKVGEDGFERRLTLGGADGSLGTVYLGDSPGFRRLFVRVDGDPAVYEAELTLSDASDKADDWTKKTVLQLEAEAIEGVRVGDVALTRGEEDTWTLEGLAEGETLDQAAAGDLVRTIANLSFRGVLGTEERPGYGQDFPVLTLEVDLGGETRTYVLSELANSEDRVLKVSSQPYYFRLSRFAAEDLTEVNREGLLSGGEEPPEAPPEEVTPEAAVGTERGLGSEGEPAESSAVEGGADSPVGEGAPPADAAPTGGSSTDEAESAAKPGDDGGRLEPEVEAESDNSTLAEDPPTSN